MKIAGQSNVKVITNEFPHHGKDTRGNLAVGSLVPNEAPVKNQNADAKPYRRTKPRSIANGGGMTVRVRGKKGSRSEAPFWQEPTPIRLPKRAAQIAREQAKLFAQTQRAQARDPSTIDYNLENYPRPLDFHKTMSTTARRAAPRRKSSQQAPKQKAGVGSRALKQSEARSSGSIAHVIHPLAASGLGYGSAHNNYYDYVYSGFFPSLERAGYKAHLNAKLSSTNSVPDSLVNSTALYHSQRRLW